MYRDYAKEREMYGESEISCQTKWPPSALRRWLHCHSRHSSAAATQSYLLLAPLLLAYCYHRERRQLLLLLLQGWRTHG